MLHYLAKSAALTISISITHIAFLTKMQKGQKPEMRFAFLISENTTSRFLAKGKIYCSKHRSRIDDLKAKS